MIETTATELARQVRGLAPNLRDARGGWTYTRLLGEVADRLEALEEALKPFAELSAKLPDEGVVVEVCRPDPQNPSPRIEPFLTKHLRTAAGLV